MIRATILGSAMLLSSALVACRGEQTRHTESLADAQGSPAPEGEAPADATGVPPADAAVVESPATSEPDAAPAGQDGSGETYDGGGSETESQPPRTGSHPVAAAGAPVKVTANMGFLEGPLWLEGPGFLIFTRNRSTSMEKLVPPMTVQSFDTAAPGVSALDPQGNLVVMSGARVVRTTQDGKILETLATGFEDGNDVIVRKDGNVYFTRPSAGQVVRLTPDRKVSAVARMTKPNGIMFSLDQKTLYVADSNDRLVKAFDVAEDGSVGPAKMFASTGDADVPDGMCLDDDDNVYVTTNPGVIVFSRDGTRLGNIVTPGQRPTNCSFGGRDRRTLYVTTNQAVWAIATPIPGVP